MNALETEWNKEQKKAQKRILNIIEENVTGIDKIKKKRTGEIILMREFFYRHGMDDSIWTEKLMKKFEELGIRSNINFIESYEQWKPFKGWASTAQSSHWSFVFKIVP